MTFDVRKAKGKALPPSTIVHESKDYLDNALSSSTHQSSGNRPKLTSPTVAASQSSGERSEMAGFNEYGDHSTGSGNHRSKIVVLKVGDALRTLGWGVSVLSVSKALGPKVITIQAPPKQLAKIPEQMSRFQDLSTRPGLEGNGAGEAMVRPPNARRRQSAISVSETGSPLRRGNGQSLSKSDKEQLNNNSKQQVKIISDFQDVPEDMYENPLESFLLGQEMPPASFHQHANVFPNRQLLSPSALSQQLSSSLPSWRERQLQLMQQLGLSADKQQQGSSSRLHRQTWDSRISWPKGSPPSKGLYRPLGPSYAPLPFNLSTNYAPPYGPVLMNEPPLLPPAMSAALAAEGWNQKLLPGVYDLSTSASTTIEPHDFETPEEFKERLTYVLAQMMFVSGETAEASPETTGMIEEIVRAQVIEMLRQATELANRRGVRSISTADLIFLIRHDKAKVSRLKTFLSWKDVRKNVKDSDEKGGGDAGEVDFDDGANLPGAGPVDSKKSSNKKAKLILPWEVQSFYSEHVPERDDEEDNEEEEEQNEATLARLASADERTKNMTRDEYVYWSDCRQASFTFRKGKRFREWAGFGVVTDSKPNDDIVDILGFLTFEIVQTLTEEALKVKAAEDLHNARTSSAAGGETKKRKREGSSLFEMPEEGRTPVEPKHVREAFRRLQIIPKKYSFMRPGYTGIRQPLRLI